MTRASLPSLPCASDYQPMIDSAIPFRATGSVSAIVGNRVEVRGLNVPVGAVCEIRTRRGERGAAKVIGFRDDSPILALMDEVACFKTSCVSAMRRTTDQDSRSS